MRTAEEKPLLARASTPAYWCANTPCPSSSRVSAHAHLGANTWLHPFLRFFLCNRSVHQGHRNAVESSIFSLETCNSGLAHNIRKTLIDSSVSRLEASGENLSKVPVCLQSARADAKPEELHLRPNCRAERVKLIHSGRWCFLHPYGDLWGSCTDHIDDLI